MIIDFFSKVSPQDAAVLVLSVYISDDLTGTCKAPCYSRHD